MTDVSVLVERLREALASATPGPYRAHDHNDMARMDEDPDKWVGYGWVGRITKNSTPDGRWDAGWLDADRRKDACHEYRQRAAADVHFVAEALNALPVLLDTIEAQAAEIVAIKTIMRDMLTGRAGARDAARAALNQTGEA